MFQVGRSEIRITAGLLLLLLTGGCMNLTEEPIVRRDFQKEHPNYTIVSIGFPDGHSGSNVVTYFIRYKKPGDSREFWSDWAYEPKNGKLELVGKGAEHIFSDEKQNK